MPHANNLPTPSSTTPFTLTARKETQFDFDHTPVIHTRNNLYISHFFNALSLAAPITEGFLMRSVRKTSEAIQDEKLKQDLIGFIGQEALHTAKHRQFNKRLQTLGYGVESLIETLESKLRNKESQMDLPALLAMVVTGEHAVYSISKVLLLHPSLSRNQDPEVTRLFQWHALEEMEHQSVCHDIFHALYGDGRSQKNLYRKAYFDSATIFFSMIWTIMGGLLALDPAPGFKQKLEFAQWLLWNPGLATRTTCILLGFLAPTFMHWQQEKEDMELINAALTSVYQR